MAVILEATGWNRVGDFLLEEVRRKLGQATRRRDYYGAYKETSYKFNDTGRFSENLQVQTIWFPEADTIQLVLTYPDQEPYSVQGKIYFETGRRPDLRAPRPEIIDAWARRKIPGFSEKSEQEQKTAVYLISMSIKKKGIGTYPIFDPGFIADIENNYQEWFNGLSEDEITRLPGIEKVFDALQRIIVLDKPTTLSITTR